MIDFPATYRTSDGASHMPALEVADSGEKRLNHEKHEVDKGLSFCMINYRY
jgi:hypothetical protein